jgi:EmrB/QacA subfamily drug resistance transporter
MNALDITIVNVALPVMGRDLHAPGTSISSVSIAYVVTIAAVITLSGWLGNRFGHRRILLIAIVVFTVASALCGLSRNLPEIVAFRVLQGVGSGLMTPVGMALLYRTFPAAERARVAGILLIPTVIAPATGPVIGGVLVSALSWQWVFLVNVPVGAAAVAFGLLFLHGDDGEPVGPFDFRGFILVSAGLAGLMFGVSEGPRLGWTSTPIVIALSAGLVLIALLFISQLRDPHPLLALRLFGDRLFRSSNAVTLLSSATFFGFLFVLALFLQNGLGVSPLRAGLLTIPEAVGVLCGSQLVSRKLYPLLGPRPLMIIGQLGIAGFLLILASLGATSSLWLMRVVIFFVGYFQAHVMVPTQVATMARVSRADIGAGSTLFNTIRQVAAAGGIALLATVIAIVGEPPARPGQPVADLRGYHLAFVVGAGLAVLGVLVALTVHNSDADSTRPLRPALVARRG